MRVLSLNFRGGATVVFKDGAANRKVPFMALTGRNFKHLPDHTLTGA